LKGQINYATSLFKKETIEKLAEHYVYALDQLLSNPGKPYSQLSLLSPAAYSRIVTEWNSTDKSYEETKTIIELFETQVLQSPDSIAVVFEGESLSYKELNERSNILARQIRAQYNQITSRDLSPDTLIGLLLDRSLEMVIGILGVLKTGGAYVPIDSTIPQERLDYILEDIGSHLIVSERSLLKKGDVHLNQDKVVYVDAKELILQDEGITNLGLESQSTDLAYVIYTSGTTGKPKGVLINNNSVVNLVNYHNQRYSKLSKPLQVALLSNYIFDFSVQQIFNTLLYGHTLHVMSKPLILDPKGFNEYLRKNKIEVFEITPTLFSHLILPYDNYELFDLRLILIGGESLGLKTITEFLSKKLPAQLSVINTYGPTEYTSDALCYEIPRDLEFLKTLNSVPIGKPLDNTRVYVLGANNLLVPVGVIGELCIGGAGLSRGYLNRPELTSERFIENPFATTIDKEKGYDRLYKTGDLVRWLSDGNLEYLGRNDEQVKIRGYRIEIGEIETALMQLEGIQQALVLVKEKKTDTGSNKYLVGYYVLSSGFTSINPGIIQEKLLSILPDYMVPSHFIQIDTVPLTINGKVDKQALPESVDLQSTDNYVGPTNEIEEQICQIWQQVLGIERVGINDDFFRIGGNSILSIQVSSRIRHTGYACQVKDIFEYKTIVKLSEYLKKKKTLISVDVERGILTGELELLPIQKWFVEQVKQGEIQEPNHWNQSFLISVPKLDTKKLENIIAELVSYHDVLRIRYSKEEDIDTGKIYWKQIYQSDIIPPKLNTLDISIYTKDEVQKILTDWQSCFDLEQGMLFQIGYLYGYEDGTARIFFSMHHMILDGISWRILTEDVKSLYEGNALPPKSSSYRQWTSKVNSYYKQYLSESVYWEEQLKDIPRYQVKNEEPCVEKFELNPIYTKSLLQECSIAYHTEVNDLLLTALGYALKDINNSNIQSITLEGHGRENIDLAIDHSRIVGWFTTMYPVRLEVRGSIKESIQFTKENLRSIPNKGIGFGVFATRDSTNYSYNNLAPISFNYFGQFDAQQGDWQVVSEESGYGSHADNNEYNIINIDGIVVNSKMEFTVFSKLGIVATSQLSDSLKKHLINIIEHCKDKIEQEGSSFTPSDFQTVQISQSLLERLELSAKLIQNSITYIYPATSLQQGFIYHALSQPEDDAYRVQQLFDYKEELDVILYLKAWNLCIEQYPILRTSFNWEENIIQIIYKNGKLNYQIHDISHFLSQEERDIEIEKIQVEDRKVGFDFFQPSLFRIHIIKQANNYYTVLKSEHHSIGDGWSDPILFSSLHHYYHELILNRNVQVKEETAYLESQEYIYKNRSIAQEYWKAELVDIQEANDINTLLSNSIDINNYDCIEKPVSSNYKITDELLHKIKTFTQKEGITVNVIVQFVWHKFLQVYSNSLKSIVGTTISGRDLPINGIEDSVGLYINTLPLIIDWGNSNTILQQLHYIQKKMTELGTYGFADLAKIQKEGDRLFHSLFIYENYPASGEDGVDHLRISLRNFVEKVDYPLSIDVSEQLDLLLITLQYDGNYLSNKKANEHLQMLGNVLQQVVNNPHTAHSEITLFDAAAYSRIVTEWNSTDKSYEETKTIIELFETQVLQSPDSIAVVFEGESLSYKELNERSNILARQIRAQYNQITSRDLSPDTLIGLLLDRSLEMVIGILGVLKTGGAYVPIDSTIPQERLDYILEDIGSHLIVSERSLLKKGDVHLNQDKVVYVDAKELILQDEGITNLGLESQSTDLAYVIYTSGTTGKPKGVLINNNSVVNLVNYHNQRYSKLSKPLQVALLSNYIFDFSVQQIFNTLLYGHTLHVMSKPLILDPKGFNEYLRKNKIEVFEITPTLFSHLILPYDNYELFDLRLILIGGESLGLKTITEFLSKKLPAQLSVINTYGPTEYTSDALCYEIPRDLEFLKTLNSVPIGKPLDNTRVYVLGANNLLVPVGVIGELCIGGAGLSRGYLNRPELTSERFIENPFATTIDKEKGYDRLYKTGDLVRWLSDGNLEYLGRNDEQVKIRGYRIEIGEIETALMQLEGIQQALVLVKEKKTDTGSNKYLVGYYVLSSGFTSINPGIIQEKLLSILPDYMVPSHFIQIDTVPLTINGKVDKQALPESVDLQSTDNYVGPTNEIEEQICQIWQQVLGIERVGINENFFRIGGDSILAIQLYSRINKTLGCNLSVADVFKYPTIVKLISSSNIESVTFVEGEI
jgi:amino acid adenylation domain-containing protein/non-ribosomal peptide synthase protein (TIGR01720 family)